MAAAAVKVAKAAVVEVAAARKAAAEDRCERLDVEAELKALTASQAALRSSISSHFERSQQSIMAELQSQLNEAKAEM